MENNSTESNLYALNLEISPAVSFIHVHQIGETCISIVWDFLSLVVQKGDFHQQGSRKVSHERGRSLSEANKHNPLGYHRGH